MPPLPNFSQKKKARILLDNLDNRGTSVSSKNLVWVIMRLYSRYFETKTHGNGGKFANESVTNFSIAGKV